MKKLKAILAKLREPNTFFYIKYAIWIGLWISAAWAIYTVNT